MSKGRQYRSLRRTRSISWIVRTLDMTAVTRCLSINYNALWGSFKEDCFNLYYWTRPWYNNLHCVTDDVLSKSLEHLSKRFNKTPLHLQKRSLDTFLKENGLIAKRVEVAFKAFESTGYAALNKRWSWCYILGNTYATIWIILNRSKRIWIS